MGRPSKLTENEWIEALKRIEAGESIRSVAASYGVSPTAIQKRVSAQSAQQEEIKALANQLVTAENKIKDLPITLQVSVHSLANDLRAISMHLAGAGRFGAATAHRLSGIANAKVLEIDDAAPLSAESMEALRGVAVLTKMANESSEIGVNLLKANKEMLTDQEKNNGRKLREMTDDDLLAIVNGGGKGAADSA